MQLDTVKPHHQSLRQSLNWQYDVVEPQSAQEELVTDVQDSTVSVKTCEVREKSVDPTPVPQEKVSRPAAEDTHPDRRYAQLFTRLQRQRRRVELVMNQERRSGTETRTL